MNFDAAQALSVDVKRRFPPIVSIASRTSRARWDLVSPAGPRTCPGLTRVAPGSGVPSRCNCAVRQRATRARRLVGRSRTRPSWRRVGRSARARAWSARPPLGLRCARRGTYGGTARRPQLVEDALGDHTPDIGRCGQHGGGCRHAHSLTAPAMTPLMNSR